MAASSKEKTINDKQELFCQEYIVDLHVTNSAIRAGYSEKTAYSIGSELLKKPEIRTRIGELMDERSKRTMVDADFVVRNLVDISQKCQQKIPVMEFDAANKCMMQKKDENGNNVWEFDSAGANRALELLGKHVAMFTDKVTTTVKQEQPLFPET